MSLQHHGAHSFKAATIEREVPPASGVYVLSNAREWIYAGETDDLRACLLRHLRETASSVAERRPTGFSYEICPPGYRVTRQARLIVELRPTCNAAVEQARAAEERPQENA